MARIRDERIDWRFKSLPDSVFGQTIGQVADAGLNVFTDGFVGPLLMLNDTALTHNLTTMADWCARHGLSHAPHGKTSMAPQLFARQLELGAWGITAATVSQLRVYRAFGVPRVVFANELVDPAGLRWVARELDADPEFEFCCWVDSVAGVDLMAEALRGAQRPVDVLVELGTLGGRSGVRDLATGHEVAAAVLRQPALRLVGVAGYEGVVARDASGDSLREVAGYLERMRTLVTRLPWSSDSVDEVLVSAGGSAFFDVVAEVLGRDWEGLPVRPVLRSGAYLSHDDGFYNEISPLGATPRTDAAHLHPAFSVWAQVISRPDPDLALLNMGKRDVPYDEGLPMPFACRRATGMGPLLHCELTKVADQHAFLVPGGNDKLPEVGEWVGFGVSHPCTTFDKWQLIPVVRNATVVDLIRTYF